MKSGLRFGTYFPLQSWIGLALTLVMTLVMTFTFTVAMSMPCLGQTPESGLAAPACVPDLIAGFRAPGSTCGAASPPLVQTLRALPSGATYRRFACDISYETQPWGRGERVSCLRRTRVFREISFHPASGLQLQALRNPQAFVHGSCRNGYAGPVMARVVAAQNWFDVAAATNGNYFISNEDQTFRPRGLLWSSLPLNRVFPGGQAHGGLTMRGNRVFIADFRGNHELKIEVAPCALDLTQTCATVPACGNESLPAVVRANLPARALDTTQFIEFIRHVFPTATLAVQVNTNLLNSQWGMGGNLFERDPLNPALWVPHFSRCTSARRRDPRQQWTCESSQRTALCGRVDGGISLLTMDAGLMYEMAVGLSPGGPCGLQCRFLYSLDGGGSSQMGLRMPANGQGSSDFNMVFGRPTRQNRGACGPYRALDHLFVIGRPARSY